MEVSCSSDYIVSVVGFNKGSDGELFLRSSVNSIAALFAVSASDRGGNLALDGGGYNVS